jgi:predicted permease
MEAILQDLRFAVRSLGKNPGFSIVAVLTLTLGIGANSAMFSIASGFLWAPLPVERPAGLVNVFSYLKIPRIYLDFPYADFQDLRERKDVFSDAVAYYPYPFGLSENGQNERTWGEIVSGNYFTSLGVRPARGRVFAAPEGEVGAAPVAVISDDLWRRRFRADPGVVGHVLRVNGTTFTIVGVAPKAFHGVYYVGFRPDLWIPAGQYDAVVPGVAGRLTQRDGPQFRVMARLAPGVDAARAQTSVQTLMTRLAVEFPGSHQGLDARVIPELRARPEPSISGGMNLAARLFLVAVGLVLLIACANVANLLLARASGRRKEIAIRLAMGASHGRLVRQLLAESLLLAGIGALAGVAIAIWSTGGLTSLLRLPTDLPFTFEFVMNGRVLLYTAMLAALAGIAFGLAPALQAVRPDVVGALKNDAGGGRGSYRSRLRGALVVGQIALSCILLITAGLALRTLGRLRDVDVGFATRGRLLLSVTPELQRYERSRGEAFYRELVARVTDLPGVRSVSLAQYVPLDFSSDGGRLFLEGQENPGKGQRPRTTGWTHVMPGFFDVMGSPVKAGRDFTLQDDSAAPGVVIVNASFARIYWAGTDPIGKRLRLERPDAPALTVVGVVRDWKYNNLTERGEPHLFAPIAQRYQGSATLVVEATGDPRALAPAVGRVVVALDPEMPLGSARTFGDLMSGRALLLPKIAASLAGAFGALALVLAVVGLYGLIAYGVSRRAREIGIRVALGARRGVVVRMVLRGGLAQAGLGVGIGLVLAFGATRALSSLLFGVDAADPLTFAAVAVLLLAVAAIASWIPARRAARVDPMVALKAD